MICYGISRRRTAVKTHYTVTEVATEFGVTVATVRDWIAQRKLIAIQPAGSGGAYRVPARALDVFRSKSAQIRGRRGRPRIATRRMSPESLYAERIAPVLSETGLTADDLLRRMMTDMRLVARYPSFASDYSMFVTVAARRTQSVARPVRA
jgi:excisionase family DNA binding protein